MQTNRQIWQLIKAEKLDAYQIEIIHFVSRIDPDITENSLLAVLALLHYQSLGYVAIGDTEFEAYIKSIGIADSGYEFNHQIVDQSIISDSENDALFYFNEGLLYSNRDYYSESKIASWINNASNKILEYPPELDSLIDATFKKQSSNSEIDYQKVAVKLSFIKPFMVLTGGPGTGKTFTIRAIIDAHKSLFGDSFKIRIAAPTGKATQRVKDNLAEIDDSGIDISTVHRLLGAKDGYGNFRKNSKNPLNLDLLIIDEVSMMDLNLWFRVIESLPEQAKLIVVGDHHQLSSIDAGAILNDICFRSTNSFSSEIASIVQEVEVSTNDLKLNDCVIPLSKTFRFKIKSGISTLSNALKEGNGEKVFELLRSEDFSDVNLTEATSDTINQVIEEYCIKPFIESSETSSVLLNPLRNGPNGSIAINTYVEKTIKQRLNLSQNIEWYEGRPVIITKNDFNLGVQNGEIGYYSAENDSIEITNGKLIPISRLTHYEPAFCITVHKSQGSEFDNVAFLVGNDQNPVLSKELLYTGVTRARESVLIVGSENTLFETIQKPTIRRSGLKNKIWE